MINFLPLDLHGGHEEFGLFGLFPGLGLLLLLLLLAATAFYLWRQGRLSLPVALRPESPERRARMILSERFARGEISSEEFIDRASILNWAPGSEAVPPIRGRRR